MTTMKKVPFNQIPKKWAFDREIGPFIRDILDILNQGRERTGGDSDLIEENQTREVYPWLTEDCPKDKTFIQPVYPDYQDHADQSFDANSLYSESQVEVKKLITKTISNEIYTAVDNMFIKSKLKSTIKLPANPSEDCVIYAHNGDGTLLTIDGNGKKINGHDKLFVKQKGNGLQIYYFIEDNEYIAI